MTVYDGDSSTSPMMGKYCGDSIPPSHVSSSNEILIHFHSDGYTTEAGFQMEYNSTGKQNTFQNNTKYHVDIRYRILGTLFKETLFFCRKVIKISYHALFSWQIFIPWQMESRIWFIHLSTHYLYFKFLGTFKKN